MKIATAFIAVGAGEGDEQEERVHLGDVPALGEQAQRVDRAVDPHIVGIDGIEGVALQQGQRLGDAAAGFEQLLAFVREVDPGRRFSGLHRRFDLVGEIMGVDHRVFDAGSSDAIQGAIEQALAGHLDQRFGAGGRERPHALAQPGGHHHGAVRQHAIDVRFEE